MKTSDFDYSLPSEAIAQTPIEPRDAAKLLVLNRASNEMQHTSFARLGDFLDPGDVLVANRSRVLPARLAIHKVNSGGKGELLLLEQKNSHTWKAMVGGKGLRKGVRVELRDGAQAEIVDELDGALRLIQFDQPIGPELEKLGQVPLPPYIHSTLEDAARYQTVYAQEPGSSAAPTAGLHFTQTLIENLRASGIYFEEVLLHVGLDTFAPVSEDNPEDHHIHSEWCQLSSKTAEVINKAKHDGKRVVAVGTTSVRVLESAAQAAMNGQTFGKWEGPTRLFILPGYEFQVVDAMITNFHLPRSTLLMLVSAFAGRQRMLDSYTLAIQKGYRFYSFGDAMLIL